MAHKPKATVGNEGGVRALTERHAESLEALEMAHLDWTLDVSLDEDEPSAVKPAILSPFLPSQAATIETLFIMLESSGRRLKSSDCILDIGCGDGRVLVAACQRFGCRGIGIDVSPSCIGAAMAMVKSEDDLRKLACSIDSRVGEQVCDDNRGHRKDQPGDGIENKIDSSSQPLSSLITWVCADCTKETSLLESLADEHSVTVTFMYIYPTLLTAIQRQIEDLSRKLVTSEVEETAMVTKTTTSTTRNMTVITAGYHFQTWPAGFEVTIAPRDPGGGANSVPIELRSWQPAPSRSHP